MQTVSQQQSAIFAKYVELNKRDVKELVENKTYDLAIKLYQATPVATPGKIKRDVEALGWGIKRTISNPTTEKGRRIANMIRAKIEQAAKRQPGEDKDAPLKRIQKIIIKLRIDAIYYMASGWLPKNYVPRGKGSERMPTLKKNQKRRGLVEIQTKAPNVYLVRITNSTDGIETLNNRTGFVQKGLRAWADDMLNYIRAKTKGRSGKTVGGF